MPSLTTDPVTELYSRTTIASSMRSADWDIVPVWARERAFFMATVESHKTLSIYKAQVEAILAGRMSPFEARREIRDWLAKSGYQATPGTEGTIKDLSSQARLNVVLETNVRMMQGYTARQQALGSLVYPAQRFARVRQSRVPRDDWDMRWQAAAASVDYDGVAPGGEQVALVKSPIWAALSRFGTPYPPFDFGSGMGVRPVRWEEAKDLGLIPDKETAQDVKEAVDDHHLEALNSTLEASGDGMDRAVREQLAKSLEGFAKWEGDVLKFTDPNGDRPVSWKEAPDVICGKLPDGFAAPQREAFAEWVKDHSTFDVLDNPDAVRDLNLRESFWRGINRILPTNEKESGTLYRGLDLGNKSDYSKFMSDIESKGYTPRSNKIADSWSTSARAAERFANTTKSDYSVIMIADGYKSGKRIDGIVRKLGQIGELNSPNIAHPQVTEGEILFQRGIRFAVQSIDRSRLSKNGTGTIYVHVTEI